MKILRAIVLMLVACLPARAFADAGLLSQSISVSFGLEQHVLYGVSRITAPAGTRAKIDIAGLGVVSVSLNGVAMSLAPGAGQVPFEPKASTDLLEIRYEAVFPAPLPSGRDARHAGRGNLVGREGIVLTGRWHPGSEGLMHCDLSAALPKGFEAVSEAEEVAVQELPDGSRVFRFSFPHPRRAVTLVAAAYRVQREQHREIELSAYVLRDDREPASRHLDQAKRLIDQYEVTLGKYPFRRFSIVEYPMAAGLSGPTYTLLGTDTVRSPAMAGNPLAHEVLHQWFGGAVLPDPRSGNWTEGLVVLLSEVNSGSAEISAAEYRKQAIAAFQAGVREDTDFPLSAFIEEKDRLSATIGYDKSAFVFHMLRQLVGNDAFDRALRSFAEKKAHQEASWDDLRLAFESVAMQKLDWFFSQWVGGKGIPAIGIADPRVRYRGDRALVSFRAVQQGAPYRMRLPVLLKTERGEVRRTIDLEKASTEVELEADSEPVELVLDGGVDLFRRLSAKEMPLSIGRFFSAANRAYLLPKGSEGVPEALAGYFRGEGIAVKKEQDLTQDEIRNSSLMIPDAGSDLARRILGPLYRKEGEFSATAVEHPFSANQVIVLISAAGTDRIVQYLPEVAQYAEYQVLSFRDGRKTEKIAARSGAGITFRFARDISGVEVPAVVSLRDTVQRVADREIVYVGELHDRFEHHRMQLEVIRMLHRKGGKIAIGMEMFQKPFQQALDDYIAGSIDEKTFLRKSEYFKRWGFDYGLYREILLYAREMKIPVVALNVRKEISSKVGKEGLQSLTEKELEEVPRELDFTDREYRERLREIYSQHRGSDARGFDLFYQAQVLWDESMALSIEEYLKKNPGTRMVVLAGSGHLAYGAGIPKRADRLNSRSYAVLINGDDVEKSIADYVFFPAPVPFDEAPRLMVQLREEKGLLSIAGFSPGSVSQKAGLEEEDVILSVDGEPVATIDDIKIMLLDKKKGDDVKVRVKRKRFLWGTVEKEFSVTP